MKTHKVRRKPWLSLLLLAATLLTSCTGARPAAVKSQPPPRPAVRLRPPLPSPRAASPVPLTFPEPLVLPQSPPAAPKTPRELVEFALFLYGRGEFGQAARFFLEAADAKGSASQSNYFRITCLQAAATSFLWAGDLEAFHRVIDRLREKELDRFQVISPWEELALLLALSDRLKKGRAGELGHGVPLPLQRLLR